MDKMGADLGGGRQLLEQQRIHQTEEHAEERKWNLNLHEEANRQTCLSELNMEPVTNPSDPAGSSSSSIP